MINTGSNSIRSKIRTRVLSQMAGGLAVAFVPVAFWWKWASDERHSTLRDVETRIRVPNVQTTDDILIQDRCQAGDVLLFDRRCERCAAGPWAALACLAQRRFLCDDSLTSTRSVGTGKFDHIGLIVPGYIKNQPDELDPSNLLLLEATASGIVARPLKTRLESTGSRSVVLLQLCSPGERRDVVGGIDEDDNDGGNMPQHSPAVQRTRSHVERELRQFRDRWIELGKDKNYGWMHSTIGLGGAVAKGLGMEDYLSGPVSPSAYFCLMGLQKSAAAVNLNERENRKVKVEDFLRDHRFQEEDAVRLRPGWRFLAPIPVRETSRS